MNDIRQRIVDYEQSMYTARSMLKRGLISKEEYVKIDTIIAQKYGVSLCSIFRKIPCRLSENPGKVLRYINKYDIIDISKP